MHLLLLPSRNLLIVIKILVVIIYCWTIYISGKNYFIKVTV